MNKALVVSLGVMLGLVIGGLAVYLWLVMSLFNAFAH